MEKAGDIIAEMKPTAEDLTWARRFVGRRFPSIRSRFGSTVAELAEKLAEVRAHAQPRISRMSRIEKE
jgi:hypothetical protein